MHLDDYFAQFQGDIDISDDFPTRAQMRETGDMLIYDANGQARTFKSLYEGEHVIGDRQLIIFVRHFYCGACQSYLKALTTSITPDTYFTMAIPTSIIIIGLGAPGLIRHYRKTTGCPFPIFTDPTKSLYKTLGMSWSLDIGRKRPEYMKDISPPAWLAGQLKQMSQTEANLRFRGGNWLYLGSEMLFEAGEVVWVHRMKNYRDHAEVDVLRRVLGIDQ